MENQTRPRYMDLHMHTNYSDGVFLNPELLVATCAVSGLDLIAITDHDTSKAYKEARRAGDEFGLVVLPGVEITTQEYHLLALNFDPNNRQFNEFLEHSKKMQEKTCEKRINILRQTGIPITLEKVKKVFPESRLGKVNISVTMFQDPECREYIRQNHADLTHRQVQKHYMGDGGIANDMDGKYCVGIREAIDNVHKARGLIGIAHPVKDIKKISELDLLLEQGIDFVEIQPNIRAKYAEKTRLVEEWARENNVPILYGSDYHGPFIMDRTLLTRGENIIAPEVRRMLNCGYYEINFEKEEETANVP